MLLNFGILLVALIIYLICNPGVVQAFFENGMNGVIKYNNEKREDKIHQAVRDKRKELNDNGTPKDKINTILYCYEDWIRRNGLGTKSRFKCDI